MPYRIRHDWRVMAHTDGGSAWAEYHTIGEAVEAWWAMTMRSGVRPVIARWDGSAWIPFTPHHANRA